MDHDHIREVLDRSATTSLVARLLSDDPDAAEREEIERSLTALDDVRAVLPLQAAGENTSVSPIVRVSALHVITSMLGAAALPIREWWSGDDPVLRFAAASVLPHRQFAGLVRPVLGNPADPMLARVLVSMDIGFEEPEWQELKVRALTNVSPAVRAAAAATLLWDEPLCAHDALIGATRDLDIDVAVEAVSTLMYYPSSSVVDALSVLADSPNELLASSAEVARARVLSDIADAVAVAPLSPLVRGWATLLRRCGVEPATEATPRLLAASLTQTSLTQRTPSPTTVAWSAEFERDLLDLDGPWEARLSALRRLDPTSVPLTDRRRVIAVLVHHSDPEVRGAAALHLSAWEGGPAALIGLLDDPMVTVSKSAMYALHDVDVSSTLSLSIRDHAWESVTDGTRVSTRASEALRTFVRHGDAADAADVTAKLVSLEHDARESVRASALEQLVSRHAEPEVRAAMSYLAEPPEVTWAVHGTLLDAAHRFGIDVGRHTLLRLGREDHAWLCGAVARLLPDG